LSEGAPPLFEALLSLSLPFIDEVKECGAILALFYFLLFLLFIYGSGVEPNPLLLPHFIVIFYKPWMADGDNCGAISGINEWHGKPKYPEENFPSIAFLGRLFSVFVARKVNTNFELGVYRHVGAVNSFSDIH
jgi:hypothetical protein